MDIFREARQNFLRRQQAAEDADLERQQTRDQEDIQPPPEPSTQPEMMERSTPGSTVLRRFAELQRPSFLARYTSAHPATTPRPSSSHYSNATDDMVTPKTPRFDLGAHETFSHGASLRTTTSSSDSRTNPARADIPADHPVNRLFGEIIEEPPPSVTAGHAQGRSRDRDQYRYDGADPAERHLAGLAHDGRRRNRKRRNESPKEREDRHRRRRKRRRQEERRKARKPPTHFLFCFPWVRSREMRNMILQSFVSGLFLVLMLSVYLGLSISKTITGSAFTILLILIILIDTIFFCHALVRICILIVRKDRHKEVRPPLPQMTGADGYAVPNQPIRVVVARDEEELGADSAAPKIRPPAYGLWRESVRVDPDRFYWLRNEEANYNPHPEDRPVTRSRRPPSYASDDGISYVVDARPRSIAPSSISHLPRHPADAGRVARAAAR